MTDRVLTDLRAEKLLRAQKALASCCAPKDERPAPRRTITPEAIERGAIAIYAQVTRNRDPEVAERKWATTAKEITKERHRSEAEACLRAAN